jgi:hypothetical protein
VCRANRSGVLCPRCTVALRVRHTVAPCRSFAVCLGVVLCLSLGTRAAHADISSWAFAGGGAGSLRLAPDMTSTYGMMKLDVGLGTPPDASVVVGGVMKSVTFFSQGTDLALTVRGASGGFVRGTWGFALDLGGFERFWGSGSRGGIGELTLGGPWGIQASALYELGTDEQRTFAAAIGLDLMRMSVYRTSGRNWFPNPFPPDGVGGRGGPSHAGGRYGIFVF